MTAPGDPSARRAARLLRWYPAGWRARYGEEFAELLLAEFAEQPRSWRRAADVARGGLLARLTGAGLTSHLLEPSEQARAGLATAACSLAAFGALGIAMWAQLAIGWEWAPGSAAATAALVAMSAAAACLAAAAAAAAVPLIWAAVRALRNQPSRPVALSAWLALTGTSALAFGSHHFENAWPGTGAHPLVPHGFLPAGAAAFGWAGTLSVSSYWAHPAALAAFPAAEIAWMAVSPLALAAAVTGVAGLVRRLDLSPRVLRYEAWLASGAAAATAVFFAGACGWVFAEGSGPGLFHAGTIDIASLAVMMLALSTAQRATGLARKSAAGLRPH
ncbi:MAG TPA: hypothetical protein VMI33_25375 [Streptosporangiaceae bacterium]|nr:hypothetical protein [Streptosporangiaceae bacterium]